MAHYKELTGQLNATGMKLTIIVSRFNSFFTEQLLKGAVDCAVRHGCAEGDITVIRVPGANEIPLAAALVVEKGTQDAVIALGAVIQGGTDHASLINTTVARALADLGVSARIPVVNGVMCANTLEQAVERSGTKAGNKGWDVTLSAIETAAVCKLLK